MVQLSAALLLALAASVIAKPRPITPNPDGARNVGNGRGLQFITGGCTSDADCTTQCCADATGVGVCSAVVAAFQAGKAGCGFGGNGNAASAAAAEAARLKQLGQRQAAVRVTINTSAPGAGNVGKGNGRQFITGQCLSNDDCASGCCATKANNGVCSAVAVANQGGKEGCGFFGIAA